jgi:hypothetical protein
MVFMHNKSLAAIAATGFLLAAPSAARAQSTAPGRDLNAPASPIPAARNSPAASADHPENTDKPDKPLPQAPKSNGGIAANAKPLVPGARRFWDRENDFLFAAVAAGRGLDYASTINLRHRGINEAFLTNSIVDNHPLFAVIEIGATAASVGVSYVFYRTGHHRLERWTSVVHTGIAVGGAIRNYNLKSAN